MSYKPDSVVQFLRTKISQSDTALCKDFKLCAVEVFESLYRSNDSLEVQEQYLAELEKYFKEEPPLEDSNMIELMKIFRETLADLKRGSHKR